MQKAIGLKGKGIWQTLQGDPQLRPNQLLAFSLPFPLFDLESEEGRRKASLVFAKTMEQLYIGPGLRSLVTKRVGLSGTIRRRPLKPRRRLPPRHSLELAFGSLSGCGSKTFIGSGGSSGKVVVLLAPSKHHFYREGALGQVSEIFTGDWPYSLGAALPRRGVWQKFCGF